MRRRVVAASALREPPVPAMQVASMRPTMTSLHVASPGLAAASRHLVSSNGRPMHLRVDSVTVLALAPVSVRATVHAVRLVRPAPYAVDL